MTNYGYTNNFFLETRNKKQETRNKKQETSLPIRLPETFAEAGSEAKAGNKKIEIPTFVGSKHGKTKSSSII